MTPNNLPTQTPGTPTPALDRLLARLRGRVSTQVWLHGLGTIAVIVAITVVSGRAPAEEHGHAHAAAGGH